MRNLQIWTQRQSRLQLLFLFRSVDRIDSIDKTVVADVARLTTGIIQSTPHGKHRLFRIPGTNREVPNVWLLSNLIGNLPEALHLKVHNSATMILETSARFGESTSVSKDSHSSLHQPFLNLMLVCIEKQEKERKNLIDKLIDQISQFVDENKDKNQDDKELNSGTV